MKTYTIKKENFLKWFYHTGADQDQNRLALSLCRNVIVDLIDNGVVEITAQEIFDGCELVCVPISFLEEKDSKDLDIYINDELMDLDWEWELKLID